jgi:hypothetical protein
MTNDSNRLSPTIYLGGITVSSERSFLERLRRDLEGPALVIANFFPAAIAGRRALANRVVRQSDGTTVAPV